LLLQEKKALYESFAEPLSYLDKQATQGGILKMTADIKTKLESLHPEPAPTEDEFLCKGTPPLPKSVIFEAVTAQSIKKASLDTNGAAGISGGDAEHHRRMLHSFGTASVNLTEAMAAMGRRLCTEYVDPELIEAFVANRLIPLDKGEGGVRPIGIGEIPRRIIGKAIMVVLKGEVAQAAGATQVCAGQEGGIDAAIHSMTELWEKFSTDCLLLIDASNAFNRLRRATALWNIRFICPSLGIILINLYRRPARLFILGGYELSSQEGVTQGCPVAMAMYALATLPLLNLLRPLLNRDKREWMPRPDLTGGGTEDKSQGDMPTQVWFADDGQGGGSLKQVRTLWDRVQRFGPGFGYYPKPSKTILIVKEQHEKAATVLFQDSKVKIKKDGHRDLGAFIGTRPAIKSFVGDKVQSWTRQINLLADIGKTQPHAAHAGYLHGLRSKWVFLQRVMVVGGTEMDLGKQKC
jgi:hypothetical protein